MGVYSGAETRGGASGAASAHSTGRAHGATTHAKPKEDPRHTKGDAAVRAETGGVTWRYHGHCTALDWGLFETRNSLGSSQ